MFEQRQEQQKVGEVYAFGNNDIGKGPSPAVPQNYPPQQAVRQQEPVQQYPNQYRPQQMPQARQPALMAAPPMQQQYAQQPTQMIPALMPQRGDFDDFLTSNFLQNQMKNVDLNEDERMLVHLTMMEADSLRVLARIPQSSELYRFKLEQYKELSTQRAEVEKLVQESRLKKMKRAIDMRGKEEDRRFENQKFLDDVRKQTVATKLAKEGKIPKVEQVSIKEGLRDLNPRANVSKNQGNGEAAVEGEYNLNHGFVVHWDYVFGVPKKNRFCQLVYAIMNGDDSILDPQIVEARPVQDQNTEKSQCII